MTEWIDTRLEAVGAGGAARTQRLPAPPRVVQLGAERTSVGTGTFDASSAESDSSSECPGLTIDGDRGSESDGSGPELDASSASSDYAHSDRDAQFPEMVNQVLDEAGEQLSETAHHFHQEFGASGGEYTALLTDLGRGTVDCVFTRISITPL